MEASTLPFVISTGAKRSGEISVWMLFPGNVALSLIRRNLFRRQRRRSPPLKREQREQISGPRREENQQRIVRPQQPHQEREQYAAHGASRSSNPHHRAHRTGRKHIRRRGKQIRGPSLVRRCRQAQQSDRLPKRMNKGNQHHRHSTKRSTPAWRIFCPSGPSARGGYKNPPASLRQCCRTWRRCTQ